MIQIGPISIPLERFYVIISFAVFLLIAEVLTRSKKAKLSNWASDIMIVVLLGSRLGFVLENLSSYAKTPLSALYFWEGGFSPLWGIIAALGFSIYYFRKENELLKWATLPSALALTLWLGMVFVGNSGNKQIVALPALVFQDLAAQEQELTSFVGKPTVVNLWATWCPPCRRELPMLAKQAFEKQDYNFVFVDQGESEQKVKQYLENNGIVLEHILLDPNGQLANHYKSRGLPTTLFLNSKGELVSSVFGQISLAVLENKLSKLD